MAASAFCVPKRMRHLTTRFIAMLAAATLPLGAFSAWALAAMPTQASAMAEYRVHLAMGALVALGAAAGLSLALYSRLCGSVRQADTPPTAAGPASPAVVAALTARIHELEQTLRTHERQVALGRVVAGLVHDLSHPIQNLVNNTTLLLHPGLDEAERFGLRRVIERERTALRRVMDDILNVARPRPRERFLVDVNATAAELVDAMRAEAQRHGVTLGTRLAFALPPIEGDRFALSRVLRNLIVNAVQATAPGGSVTLVTRLQAGRVTLDVVDTGCGIARERLASIFDDYVTTRQHGHGLGLAVSKQMVEQLEGTIDVTSEPGVGTCFTLSFPARQVRLVEAAS